MDDYNPRTRYEHYYVRMARLEGRGELQKRYPDDFYVRHSRSQGMSITLATRRSVRI